MVVSDEVSEDLSRYLSRDSKMILNNQWVVKMLMVSKTTALFVLTMFGILLSSVSQAVDFEDAKAAVVKVYVTSVEPDYYEPWSLMNPRNSTGSGVIIDSNRVLTNAHVVADERYIQVSKHGEAKKYRANVMFVSHAADLALLEVEDQSFFDNVDPLALGQLPKAQEQVIVLGYPVGGKSLSVTQGVLSRIEHISYVHSGRTFLAGQIDAAINSGNSGGPVIKDNKIVGIVMQEIPGADNLGYMVPPVMIEQFLTDVGDGQFDGIPELGIVSQPVENPGMKTYLGLAADKDGILVKRVFPRLDKLVEVLPGDIITAVDGYPIAEDQTIEFREGERTRWSYLVDTQQMGGAVELSLLRDGQPVQVEVPLFESANDHRLVPLQQYDVLPQYHIVGGIVFTPLTVNLMQRWGSDWRQGAPVSFLHSLNKIAKFSGEERVVALRVLSGDVNTGYHDYSRRLVQSVNGERFDNFAEFVTLLNNNQQPYLSLVDENEFELVIDVQQSEQELPRLLQRFNVPAPSFVNPK